jgi:hypothetical protein
VDTADYPAAILLYMNPNSPGAAGFGDTQLQTILRQAGHRLHSLRSLQEVRAALNSGRYDVVLADIGDAGSLREMIAAAPSQPVLLPWVFQDAKANAADKERFQTALKQAKAQHRIALKAPSTVGAFLSAIDRVMESRPKQARLKAAAPAKISMLQ